MTLSPGIILKSRWKVSAKLGEGACAIVYSVQDIHHSHSSNKDSMEYVAKVIPLPTGSISSKKYKEMKNTCDTLYYEYSLYRGHFNEFSYRPILPESDMYGEDHGVRFMIIQRLQYDLGHFAMHGDINTKSIAEIGLQILDGVRIVHQKGFLVTDLKPENFMLNSAKKVYFIDFGLMERFAATGTIAAKPGRFEGTPTYASLQVHEGGSPGRNDDIEALGYVLLALSNRLSLPWGKAKSDNECRLMKRACDVVKLAASTSCQEVGELILSSRARPRADVPDYEAAQRLLERLRDKKTGSLSLAKASRVGRNSRTSSSLVVEIADTAVEELHHPVAVMKITATSKNSAVLSSSKRKVDSPSVPTRSAVVSSGRSAAVVYASVSSSPRIRTAVPASSRAKATEATAAQSVAGPFRTSDIHDQKPQRMSSLSAGIRRSSRLSTGSNTSSGSIASDCVHYTENSNNYSRKGSTGPFSIVHEDTTRRGSESPTKPPLKRSKLTPTLVASKTKHSIESRSATQESKYVEENGPFHVSQSDEADRGDRKLGQNGIGLQATLGPFEGTRFSLSPWLPRSTSSTQTVITVGRGDSVDVQIPDEAISESHFSLKALLTTEASAVKLYIRDDKSTHGTRVNSKHVSGRWTTVNIDDVISAGDSKFLIVSG